MVVKVMIDLIFIYFTVLFDRKRLHRHYKINKASKTELSQKGLLTMKAYKKRRNHQCHPHPVVLLETYLFKRS